MAIAAGDWTHFQGTSLTWGGANEGLYPWMLPPGGLVDRINARWAPGLPIPVPNGAASSGRLATVAGTGLAAVASTQPGYRHINVSWYGHSGGTAAQIAADLPSTMFVQVPAGLASPVLVIESPINDAFLIHQGSETLADFQAGVTSQFTQIFAKWPAARVYTLSCLCLGELTTGNAWGANSCDAEILACDNALSTLAGSFGVGYVDLRATLLAWEIANNPTQDPGGHAVQLEGNNVHPTLRGMKEVMATAFLAQVVVSP